MAIPHRVRWSAFVALVAVAAASAPGTASAAPTVVTSIENVVDAWQLDPPPEPGAPPVRRYPLTVAYEGRAEVDADTPGAFAEDTWGAERTVPLPELSPDLAPDALLSPVTRMMVKPIKLDARHDLGSPLSATVSPFGPDIRFGQGTMPDPFFWGAAAAGSDAIDGGVNEMLVLNGGMPTVFPDRPLGPPGGHLAWERTPALLSPTSRGFDPTTGTFLSTTLVAAVDHPFLRVDGGDLTDPAAEQLRLSIPGDTELFGAVAVYPTGLPGVTFTWKWSWPTRTEDDPYTVQVDVGVDPSRPWPESRSVGPLREWMWRPHVVLMGRYRSSGEVGTAVSTNSVVPVGSMVSVLDADGTEHLLGPTSVPGSVEIENVEGRNRVTFLPLEPASLEARGEPAPAEEPAPGELRSPEVRGHLPEGVISARVTERGGVRVVEDLAVEDDAYGALAVPYLEVDGAPIAALPPPGPPAVIPQPFANGPGTFYGTGLLVPWTVRAGGVSVSLAWQAIWTNAWSAAFLYVLDVHPIAGGDPLVAVDWWSEPAGDTFTAQGVEVPHEIVTHEEGTGQLGDTTPEVQAVTSGSGKAIRYGLELPLVVGGQDPHAAGSFFALLVRPDAFTSDPLDEVDGDALTGALTLVARQTIGGVPPSSQPVRGWIRLAPPAPFEP